MGGTLKLIICLCSLLLHTGTAVAANGKVLVVHPPPTDKVLYEALGRLRAELKIQGFEVISEQAVAGEIPEGALKQLAARNEAFAAIAIARKPGEARAEVQIVDRITGKTLTRQLDISYEKGGPTMLAIRATELLRTSLLEVEQGSSLPPDIVGIQKDPPSEEVLRFAQPQRKFQVGAGVSTFWLPELGVALGANLFFNFRPVPSLRLTIELVGPIFGGEYRAANGSASLREEFGLLGAGWNFGADQPGQHWEGGPQLALGIAHLAAQGEADAPFVADSKTMWAFAVTGGGFIEFFVSETLSLNLSVNAFTLLPRPVIAVAEQETSPLAIQGMTSLRGGVSF